MQFVAKALFVRMSPYKLRPLADVVRGKNVLYALHWLATHPVRKATPVRKAIESAAGNAKNLKGIEPQGLVIQEIKVDEGPVIRYFRPGAMGRANGQKKRLCHISVIVKSIDNKEA
jgi:large subunit ribosomal protein L22